MKNILQLKKKASDNWFLRNFDKTSYSLLDKKIINLIKNNDLKGNKILEIGCSDGTKLFQYSKLLMSKINFGVDLSKKAIDYGKKKYKNLDLLNISSLEIDKIKYNFDIIICGFFLYQLDREYIFEQFDLIFNKLNKNGYLIIYDFDPLFNHTNIDHNHKNLLSFKMSYDEFLKGSGLFEIIYKSKSKIFSKYNKLFKSSDISLTLYRKIDFRQSYPENI